MIIIHSERVGTLAIAMTIKVAPGETAGLSPKSVCKTGRTLRKLPSVAAVTCIANVQEPGTATVPPGIVVPDGKVTDAAVAIGAPPQVVVGSPALVTPTGRLSVKAAVKVAAPASVLVKVMVRVERSPV